MNYLNACRLCSDRSSQRNVVRYGIRHYCHAECGFDRWGDDFLRRIPAHEIGALPYRLILVSETRKALALELCPHEMEAVLAAMKVVA